jgi:threonine dehydrogenase-like Zn-dependent dehydrogenase
MKVKLFYTTGHDDILEMVWDKPEPKDDEIEVESIYTGICSSDVAMFNGEFTTLPKEIQGHECVGRVTKLGEFMSGVKVGDYVATRGEPGFADYYNCNFKDFVIVPKAEPKYIIEPVACSINIASSIIGSPLNSSIAIIGTGFLARMIYEYLHHLGYNNFTVIGGAFKDYWSSKKDVEFNGDINAGFDYFIDMTSNPDYFNVDFVNTNGTFIIGAEKWVTQVDFSKFLWKNITIKCPSPRDIHFQSCMKTAVELIKTNKIKPKDLWGKEYHRDNAFEAFNDRLKGKERLRSYVTWK